MRRQEGRNSFARRFLALQNVSAGRSNSLYTDEIGADCSRIFGSFAKLSFLPIAVVLAFTLPLSAEEIQSECGELERFPVADKCDCLAADPDDPNRRRSGVILSELNWELALPLCEVAVKQNPDDKTLAYQLLRTRSQTQMLSGQVSEATLEELKGLADLPYSPAYVLLAVIHGTKDSIHSNPDLQEKYLWSAVDLENPAAKRILAFLLIQDKSDKFVQGQAGLLLKSAAEDGDTFAQFVLGTEYYLAKNFDESKYWLRLAAEGGETQAMIRLFNIYDYHGAPVSRAEAFSWIDKAIRAGDYAAYLRLVLWAGKNPDKEGLLDQYKDLFPQR